MYSEKKHTFIIIDIKVEIKMNVINKGNGKQKLNADSMGLRDHH